MYVRKIWDSPICSICNLIPENTKHFISCTDHHVKRKYQNLLKNSIKFLDRINTHPNIILVFHKTLHQKCPTSFAKTSINSKCDHNILIAAQELGEIQWYKFFKGHISNKWKKAQHSYAKEMILIPPPIDTWLEQIILHIYNFSFQM